MVELGLEDGVMVTNIAGLPLQFESQTQRLKTGRVCMCVQNPENGLRHAIPLGVTSHFLSLWQAQILYSKHLLNKQTSKQTKT